MSVKSFATPETVAETLKYVLENEDHPTVLLADAEGSAVTLCVRDPEGCRKFVITVKRVECKEAQKEADHICAACPPLLIVGSNNAL